MDWLILALAILTCIVVAVVWIREEISYRHWRDDARKDDGLLGCPVLPVQEES